MSELTEFLLARIAEDELAAAYGPAAADVSGQPDLGDYLVQFPPSRVLAECEAKRRIVATLAPMADVLEVGAAGMCLKYLAGVYADHPDLPRGMGAVSGPGFGFHGRSLLGEPTTYEEALADVHSRYCADDQHDPACRLLRGRAREEAT